jgi:flagellar biosynthesis/type III secretory pathway chaperone
MKKNKFTCEQKICFIFEIFPQQIWFLRNVMPLKKSLNIHQMNSRSVRELNAFLSVRLERIARMMDLLQEAHDHWVVYGKKNKIIMETDTYDFNEALDILSSHGFNKDDYILRVEYERKWGML